jgi:hypothetical protein
MRKTTLYVKQEKNLRGDERYVYVVTKIINATEPTIGDILSRQQVTQLIADDVTVHITGSEKYNR